MITKALFGILLLIGPAGRAWTQENPLVSGLTTPKELEPFVDKLFNQQMERLHIPGGVFILVKDGHVFLAKGYGYADLKGKKPVSPNRTLFRVGSVSKLFTATAVMQLWELQRLNLDDDVNHYLRTFQLKNNYSKPVTIGNLLTHTAGFDEQYIGKAARTESDLIPLDLYLAKWMPPRITPPGQFISYSNHGYALLGDIVQQVSGSPFDEYVQQKILIPLGMARSTFHQPPPPDLARDLAFGYVYKDGVYQLAPLDYLDDAPAGSLVTTATDMARFMIAQLQQGRLGEVRILEEKTIDEMQRVHFTPDPNLPGVCYGFWEYFANGQRAISHDGGWTGFFSLIFLLPRDHVGFFLAINSLDLQNLTQQVVGEEFIHEFMNRYYPVSGGPVPPHPIAGSRAQVERFTGSYLGRIPPRHTFEKIISLFTQAQITAGSDGELIVTSPFSEPTKWIQIGPLVFQKTDGTEHIVFREDVKGHITDMFDPEANWRVPWYEASSGQLELIGLFVLIFLSTLIWPLAYLIQFVRKWQRPSVEPARMLRVLALLTGTLNLLFLFGFAVALQSYPGLVWYGVPGRVTALLVIPCLTTALTAALLASMWTVWKTKSWSLFHRCHYSVVALTSLGFVEFLLHWNLLGFQY